MGILRLSHVDVTVTDLDLASAYYTEVIGMDHLSYVARFAGGVNSEDEEHSWVRIDDFCALAAHQSHIGAVRKLVEYDFALLNSRFSL